MPVTAQDLATLASRTIPQDGSNPKPTLVALPNEVFNQIAHLAIPEDASLLDAASLRPKATTLNLQLVCKLFRTSVLEQYFRRVPLQIHLFNAELHDLLTRDPNRNGGCYPDFLDIHHAIVRHATRSGLRVFIFKQIPLYRFRRIEIHLIPQLASINLPKDKLEAFFHQEANIRIVRVAPNDADQGYHGHAGDND